MQYNIYSTASNEVTELCKLKKIHYYLNLTGIFVSFAFSVSKGRIDETTVYILDLSSTDFLL
jgi:hypothetical protein